MNIATLPQATLDQAHEWCSEWCSDELSQAEFDAAVSEAARDILNAEQDAKNRCLQEVRLYLKI